MVTISVPLQFDVSYGADNLILEIPAGCHRFAVELAEGSHTATSQPLAIGSLPGIEGRRLMAQLSFAYEWDAAEGTISVCGSDFISARAMYLTTFPEGMDEVCHERIAGSGFVHDDHFGNPHWFYPTPLMPGLDTYLQQALVPACEAMIVSLQAIPELMVRVRRPLEGVPIEVYMDLLAVHRGGRFVEYYDPAKSYDSEYRYVGVESIYAGTAMWPVNGNFANVLGSTGDPKHGVASWVALWALYCNGGVSPINCTSNGFPPGFVCNAPLYGGHIIAAVAAASMPTGSNNVYLLPICNSHNNVHFVGTMHAIHYQNAIWLNHFNQ